MDAQIACDMRGARILRGPVNNYSQILLYNNITSHGGMRAEREGEWGGEAVRSRAASTDEWGSKYMSSPKIVTRINSDHSN